MKVTAAPLNEQKDLLTHNIPILAANQQGLIMIIIKVVNARIILKL